jgi:hypothetical protein
MASIIISSTYRAFHCIRVGLLERYQSHALLLSSVEQSISDASSPITAPMEGLNQSTGSNMAFNLVNTTSRSTASDRKSKQESGLQGFELVIHQRSLYMSHIGTDDHRSGGTLAQGFRQQCRGDVSKGVASRSKSQLCLVATSS